LDTLQRWQKNDPKLFNYVRIDPFLKSLHDDQEFWAIVADVESVLAKIRDAFQARQETLADTSTSKGV